MRAKMTSLSISLENPGKTKISTDDGHENVNRNGTRNLTSSGGPHFCLVVFQELNILPDQFLSDQLGANRLSKLKRRLITIRHDSDLIVTHLVEVRGGHVPYSPTLVGNAMSYLFQELFLDFGWRKLLSDDNQIFDCQ